MGQVQCNAWHAEMLKTGSTVMRMCMCIEDVVESVASLWLKSDD